VARKYNSNRELPKQLSATVHEEVVHVTVVLARFWRVLVCLHRKEAKIIEVGRNELIRRVVGHGGSGKGCRVNSVELTRLGGVSVSRSFLGVLPWISDRIFVHFLRCRRAVGHGVGVAHSRNKPGVARHLVDLARERVGGKGILERYLLDLPVGLGCRGDGRSACMLAEVCVVSPSRRFTESSAADVLHAPYKSSVSWHDVLLFSHNPPQANMLRRRRRELVNQLALVTEGLERPVRFENNRSHAILHLTFPLHVGSRLLNQTCFSSASELGSETVPVLH
jgi:hypothetical protein